MSATPPNGPVDWHVPDDRPPIPDDAVYLGGGMWVWAAGPGRPEGESYIPVIGAPPQTGRGAVNIPDVGPLHLDTTWGPDDPARPGRASEESSTQ